MMGEQPLSVERDDGSSGSSSFHTLPTDRRTSNGVTSITAAATAILGMITALWPGIPVLDALIDVVPQLQIVVPVILTSVGAIVAAFTHPPSRRK